MPLPGLFGIPGIKGPRIFRSVADDSVEETLRAMHLANTVDNTYEWGLGWVRTIIMTIIGMLSVSAAEFYWDDVSLWENTVNWGLLQVESFSNWLVDLVS
jgi:hypothetical protein|tara:strand:- start:102 stop:401 length:300 start_codon:yes stop_codon:yes gene_type:complete